MKMRLNGCKPEPFSSYLKALAILRLIGEQKDQKIKGWWEDDIFNIESSLGSEDIIQFFLDEYKPTPIVSPWNGGSGFHKEGDKIVLQDILSANEKRFELYKDTINKIQNWHDDDVQLSDHKNKKTKADIIHACRSRLDEKVVEWIDAAILIDSEDNLKPTPILGTGGNEGNLEYSFTFMKHIKSMLLSDNREKSQNLLKNALFEEPVSEYVIGHVGKFDPGHSGGYNQGFGIEQKDFPSNPWNFIFLLEGTILWSSSIAKRNGINKDTLRSPFTVRPSPTEFESSNSNKESEIWVPLWNNPMGISELRAFFREGRSDLGRKSARTGLEFAEAITSLGVDRGINKFIRYSLQVRRGQSFIAIPSGQFKVSMLSESDLIRELNSILSRVDSFMRKFKPAPPNEYISARRRIDEAIFAVLKYGGAHELKMLIASFGKFEKLIARRDINKEPKLSRPITGISPRWLIMADDGSIEFRIAAVLASIKQTDKVGSFRANLEPVDPNNPFEWSNSENQIAWFGNNLAERLSNVLKRRIIDADRFSCCSNPFWGRIGLSTNDIAYFIDGNIDEEMVENLIFGLMWLNWSSKVKTDEILKKLRDRWDKGIKNIPIPRSWALLKLLFLPGGIFVNKNERISIKPENSIISLLNAGRIGEACQIAEKRLYYSGLSPIKIKFPDEKNGQRISAALLLPVNKQSELEKLVLTIRDIK